VSIIDVEPATDVVGLVAMALAHAESVGDQELIASVLEQRAVLPPYDDDLLERAAAMFAELGRPDGRARVAINAGSIALNQERFELAVERCRAALELVRESGNDHGVGVTLLNLASALLGLGRDAEAYAALAQGFGALDRVGDEAGRIGSLELGAVLLARAGELDTAAELQAGASMARSRANLEPDANDRRIELLYKTTIAGKTAQATTAEPANVSSFSTSLERLREALGTVGVERDVPSAR
jgi:tetratricopeptide (TPR) repeat protein